MPYPFNESDGESETAGMELTEVNNENEENGAQMLVGKNDGQE